MKKSEIQNWPKDQLIFGLRNHDLLNYETIKLICRELLKKGYSHDDIAKLYPGYDPKALSKEIKSEEQNLSEKSVALPKTESPKKKVRIFDLGPKIFLYFYLFSLAVAHSVWWLNLQETGIASPYAVLLAERANDWSNNSIAKGAPEAIHGLAILIVSIGGFVAFLSIIAALIRFVQALYKWRLVYFLAGLIWLAIPVFDFIITQIALN